MTPRDGRQVRSLYKLMGFMAGARSRLILGAVVPGAAGCLLLCEVGGCRDWQ